MSKRYEKAETQLIISCVGGNYTLHLISAKSPFYDKRCHATKHDLSSIDIGHVYHSEVLLQYNYGLNLHFAYTV